jgi:hypothetical protein
MPRTVAFMLGVALIVVGLASPATAQAPNLDGRWTMDAEVKIAHNIGDRHRGTTFERTWFIRGDSLRFEGANGNFIRYTLVNHGDYYTVSATQPAYCYPSARKSGLDARFRMTFWVSQEDTGQAVELQGSYRYLLPAGDYCGRRGKKGTEYTTFVITRDA